MYWKGVFVVMGKRYFFSDGRSVFLFIRLVSVVFFFVVGGKYCFFYCMVYIFGCF